MTRKPPRLAALILGCLALAIAGSGEAAGQFGFFGSERPLQYRKAYQLRPRYRPQPIVPPPLTADVPLPPPRPHFPGDPPDAAPPVPATAEPPAAATPVEVPKGAPPPAEMGPAKPVVTTPPSPESKPLESTELPKPAKPELPARAEEGPGPQHVIPPKGTPSMTVGPTPEELPPKGQSGAKPAAVSPGPSSPAPSGPAPSAATPPLPPEKPAELKPSNGVAPSGARLGETPRQPDDDAACADKLKARNVVVEPTTIGPQKDDRCTIVRPVHLVALTLADGGKVEFPEHPTIACTTADAFSLYVRDLLAPLAKGTFGSPVAAVWTGPGLECRSRDNIFGAKLSAHGQGLAIDIAQLRLADGRKIEVGQAKDDAGQAFENAARAAACGYFHTVLGPGSDSYHRTHWHFDLIVRGAQGDSKYCK